jgi:hypothetical protein
VGEAGTALPASGMNLIINDDGESVPESISDFEDSVARKKEEVNILIDIQKEAGFTFEAGEDEIQSKLLDLEKIDCNKMVEREQGGGYR